MYNVRVRMYGGTFLYTELWGQVAVIPDDMCIIHAAGCTVDVHIMYVWRYIFVHGAYISREEQSSARTHVRSHRAHSTQYEARARQVWLT